MMSAVIGVAMLPPSGATLRDFLAALVETTPQRAHRTFFSSPARGRWQSGPHPSGGRIEGADGDAPRVRLAYAAPRIAAIPTGERQRAGRGPPDAYLLQHRQRLLDGQAELDEFAGRAVS